MNEVLQAWAAEHDRCQICLWRPGQPTPEGCLPKLEIHHIGKGSRRKHVQYNLLTLCWRCHQGTETGDTKFNLTLGQQLAAKALFDPDNWEPLLLARLLWSAAATVAAIEGKIRVSRGLPDWVWVDRREYGV